MFRAQLLIAIRLQRLRSPPSSAKWNNNHHCRLVLKSHRVKSVIKAKTFRWRSQITSSHSSSKRFRSKLALGKRMNCSHIWTGVWTVVRALRNLTILWVNFHVLSNHLLKASEHAHDTCPVSNFRWRHQTPRKQRLLMNRKLLLESKLSLNIIGQCLILDKNRHKAAALPITTIVRRTIGSAATDTRTYVVGGRRTVKSWLRSQVIISKLSINRIMLFSQKISCLHT